jgi:hypothetical protein
VECRADGVRVEREAGGTVGAEPGTPPRCREPLPARRTRGAPDQPPAGALRKGAWQSPKPGLTPGNRHTQVDLAPGGTSTTYGYDQENRLTSFLRGTTTASYAYNGDGQRMSKTVGGTTTQYTWSGGLLLGDGTASYIYGPGGMVLEQVQGTTPYYYQPADHADLPWRGQQRHPRLRRR